MATVTGVCLTHADDIMTESLVAKRLEWPSKAANPFSRICLIRIGERK